MKIAVDFGHGTGQDRGASGYLNEEKVIREYGPLVIAGLQKLGHTVYNVTPTQGGLTLGQSLAYRVNKANYYNVDLFLCLHVNAFKTDQAQGAEVEYKSSSGKVYANEIENELLKLGFTEHGEGSVQRNNLYVLNHTNAVAVLVEPFFCDNKSDCNKYNPKTLANAIIRGVTGHDVYLGNPYVVTNYLPIGAYGIELNALWYKYFANLGIERWYMKHDTKGMWIETQYLTQEKCVELKNRLGNLFYAIKNN